MKPDDLPLCLHCNEPVAHDEQGNINQPAHYFCLVRMVVGGLNHLLGKCTCCGGTESPDPPYMTRRQAAFAAYLHWNMKPQTR